MRRLILVSAPKKPACEFEGEVFSMGRAAGNDFSIAEASISRNHAQIRNTADGFIVADTYSKAKVMFTFKGGATTHLRGGKKATAYYEVVY